MDENEIVTLEVDLDAKEFEASIEELTAALDAARKAASGMAEKIAAAFGTAKGAVKGAAEETVTMKDVMNLLAENVKAVADALRDMMTQMETEQGQDMLQGWTANALEFTSILIESKELIKKAWNSEVFQGVIGVIGNAFASIPRKLGEIFGKIDISELLKKAKTSITGMVNNAGDAFTKLYERMKTGLVEAASAFVQFAQGAKAKLSELGPQMGELAGKVGSFFSGMGSSILTNITGLTTKVGAFFANMGTTALNSMTSLGQSIAAVFSGSILPAISTAFQSLSSGITAALGALSGPVGIAVAAIGAVIAAVALLVANWDKVKVVAAAVWEQVAAAWDSAAQWFSEHVTTPLGKLWQDFSSGFMKVWEEVGSFFKGTVNGIIGFVNGLISAAVKGINTLINAMNSLHFTVPDWVPVLGGSRFGFSLSTLSTPQIPYLAQGAVLPANKPFLAMVGDQRHGTNIEAPLATIQEAVGLVMRDYAAANMAGHEATVEVLRDILTAVLGIEIGDTVIGQAAARYNRRMAVMRGGM